MPTWLFIVCLTVAIANLGVLFCGVYISHVRQPRRQLLLEVLGDKPSALEQMSEALRPISRRRRARLTLRYIWEWRQWNLRQWWRSVADERALRRGLEGYLDALGARR